MSVKRAFHVGIWFTGLVLIVLVFESFGAISGRPAYDESDPDYAHYSRALAEARTILDRRDPTAADRIDLSRLNGGRWKTACVFGGYGEPIAEMDKRSVAVSDRDRARLIAARSMGARLATVEEYEAMIAYVDLSDTAHFIHFRDGLGAGGQHFVRCISKPETRVPLEP